MALFYGNSFILPHGGLVLYVLVEVFGFWFCVYVVCVYWLASERSERSEAVYSIGVTRGIEDNISVNKINININFKLLIMSTIQKQFKLKTSFQIIYSHEYKLYDFTIIDLKTNEIIYHYHIKSLKEINKLIQEFK